ncbi:hypothetical protein BH09ACT7_BH09ACT7_12980 [soil metagenome]
MHRTVTLAGAVPPPVIDPGALPPDGPPGPGLPLVQTQACAATGVLPGSDPRVVSAAQNFMNPPTLWPGTGRGTGVTVALIDTGVSPSGRLPHLRGGVVTVNAPAVFADDVLAVAATDDTDQPATYLDGTEMTLRGPWVGVAAPGNWVQGFDNRGDLINGKVNHGTGELGTISGTSFAAAYVSGLAALMRAKFPDLTAAGVIQKIEFTAHAPLGVVTNRMGHGVVDPNAALAGDPPTAEHVSAAQPNTGRRSALMRLAGLAVVGAVIAAAVVVVTRAGKA